MIACIIIVGASFGWLGYESRWLTINLMAESMEELDRRLLAPMWAEWYAERNEDNCPALEEARYQAWLFDHLNEPTHKITWDHSARPQLEPYQRAKIDGDLAQRRAGEAIYQRGFRAL